MQTLKKSIHLHLQEILDTKIETAKSAIKSAKESRDNETKSSVGDKYETGRAMMQIEQERHEGRLLKAMDLDKQLGQINLEKKYTRVETGSLVITKNGTYFISIGIGKISLDSKTYFVISVRSPIGQAMLGKEEGESFVFQGKEVLVEGIY